jgi:hypothetical protein
MPEKFFEIQDYVVYRYIVYGAERYNIAKKGEEPPINSYYHLSWVLKVKGL